MTIEAQRAARRAAMPITAQLMEQYAEWNPTLIYARENGRSYGKPQTDENAHTFPRDFRAFEPVKKEKR